MTKKILISGVVVFVLLSIGIIGYVLRPPAEPSAPIEAIPVETERSDIATVEDTKEAVNLEDEDSSQETGDGGVEESPDVSGEINPSGTIVYEIVQEESEVRFSIDEVLRGNPTTAVGTSNQVAGEIAIDFENPNNTQLGIIQVNARTLVTDRSNRDRMIRNEILDTGAFEFIIFEPTTIKGLPKSTAIGDSVPLQISGDLNIRDLIQQVTFEAMVKLVSEDRIEGYATTMILRSDYEIGIPSVPSVANVSDEVILEIDFVAVRKQF